ncbi:MAG TPA: HEAT repeat domain-containing protein [Terriglobales bacterium]|nr:HEAT repeat domain-containing protein [Terriglobales bacterium]
MNRNRTGWIVLLFAWGALAWNAYGQDPVPNHASTSSAKPASVLPETLSWKILKEGVSDHRAVKRQGALIALSTVGPLDRALKLVFSAVQDKDAAVRETAVSALGEMHSIRAVPVLKQSLEDDSGPVRFAAAKALWQLGDHSGRSLITEVLSKQDSSSDGMLKQGLTDANKKLHSPSDLARIGLTQASGVFLGPFSYGVVMAAELTKDKDAPARAISASLLASDHDPKSVRALQDAVQDENAGVRTAAAKAIGSHPCKQLLPALQFLLDDKDEVKYMAAASILRIESRPHAKHPAPECEGLTENLAQQTPAEVR